MKNLIPNKRVVINPHYEMVANKKRKELFPYRFLKGWMPIILSGKKASCRTVYDLLCKRTKPTIFLPFTYFRLSWVSTAAQAFLWLWWVVGCSLAVVQGLLIRWLPLVRSTGAVVGAHALQHVGSSRTRDWTHVSCIGRQILHHWAAREAAVCF